MGRSSCLLYCLLLSYPWDAAGLKDTQPHGKWAAALADHRHEGPDEREAVAGISSETTAVYTLREEAATPLLAVQRDASPRVSHGSGDRRSVSAMQRRRQQTQGPYTTLLILLLVFLPLFVAFVLVVMFVAGPSAKNAERSSRAPSGAASAALIPSRSSPSVSAHNSPRMSPVGSFVAREGTGISVVLNGAIRPQPQDTIVNVMESGVSSGDLFAQICISEDHQGTGILVHGAGRAPVAMLDTSFAFGAAGGPPPANRMVRIHKVEAGSTSWDYVKEPYAEVRPAKGGFVMNRGGGFEELMAIRADQAGQIIQVVSARSILAQLEVSPNGSVIHMSGGSFDRYMLLCAIVSAMKLG